MHRRRVAVLLQPGCKLQNANRRHAVGQHREVGLTGNEVEAGGMNEGDAHGDCCSRQSGRQKPVLHFRCPKCHAQTFAPGALPAEQGNRMTRNAQGLCNKGDQRLIGPAIYRRRGQPKFQRITMLTDDLRTLGPRLHMQGQDTAIAIAVQPHRHHRSSSSACRMTMASSGERSILATVGTKRCSGRRIGCVSCASGRLSGE